jgi:hypothetical protein
VSLVVFLADPWRASCNKLTLVLLRVTRPRRRLVRWIVWGTVGVFVGLWIAIRIVSRAPILREQLVQTLNDKLDADVELDALEVRTIPRLRIHGDGLKLRLHGQQNPNPFIEVRHFEVAGGLWGMLRRHHRFTNVELDGLRITIPPRTPNDKTVGRSATSAMTGSVIIERLQAKDAQLIIVPKNPAKQPKVFAIHSLDLNSVGFDRSIPFTATLTNAIPKGEIATQGAFGAWVKDDPGSTPLRGRYSFERADLNTIKGLGGTLTSHGDFSGILSEIDVHGTTKTPDFTLDVGGAPVPLETTFHAVVDGTNGDTYLKQVDARLADTIISASGAIVAEEGVKGRSIAIDLTIAKGRVQDLLRLAVSAPRPVMLGTLTLSAALLLPPGPTSVADRMALTGHFALRQSRFTDPEVQRQLANLSRRAQGKKQSDPIPAIVSDLSGRFALRDATVRFQELRFDVPGATVALAGRYGLRNQQVDFAGTLGMDASISKAAGGGIKSMLLKPFDPLFRKQDKGALLPITITGPRTQPKFGLNWGKVLK